MREKVLTIKKTELKKTIENLIEKGSKKFSWISFSFSSGRKAIDYYWYRGDLYLIDDWGNKIHVASFDFEEKIWKNWMIVRTMNITYINESYVK